MKFLLLLSLSSALASALLVPLITPRAGTLIPGRYIVKIRKSATPTVLSTVFQLLGITPIYVYNFGNFSGFTAYLPNHILFQILYLPGVEWVEQDATVTATLGEVDHLEKRAYVTQSSASWSLARISRKVRGSTSYIYDSTAGANTCVYVIDTGVATNHPEFEGRATFVANFAGDGLNTDGNGHGTHCAGTIGSRTYGVAKNARIFAVKVLDSSGVGTNSGVIAGINFVANDARTRGGCSNGVIGSMSLGGALSAVVNNATANVVAAGIFMAVAAGNDGKDAVNSSPASEPSAYTVGAMDSSDKFAYFSNFGSAVDILAPGVSILSTWLNNGTNILSGTSMATPYVAGLAAYILGLEGNMDPTKLAARLTALSSKNLVTGVPSGTKNYLAFNGSPIS